MTLRKVSRPHSIAPRALDWFAGGGRAHPIHLGTQVSYFGNGRGQVLGLASATTGLGPLFATLPAGDELPRRLRGLAASTLFDESCKIAVRGLVGRSFEVAIDGAKLWEPSPEWSRLPAGQSLAPAMRPLRLEAKDLRSQRPLYASGSDPLQTLIDRWPDDSSPNARALAGRGEGLTPAGDDRLIGFFYALWATQNPARHQARSLALEVAPRTTQLAAALLRAAADGEAPVAWHRLINALARGETDLEPHLRAVLDWGATSGRHTLAAFVEGCRGLVPYQPVSSNPRPRGTRSLPSEFTA